MGGEIRCKIGQILKYWNKSQRSDFYFFFLAVENKDLQNERLGAKVVNKMQRKKKNTE